MAETAAQSLLRALSFAAHHHRDQRRKGAGAPPFINHAIEVAEILAAVGGVTDPETLQAAVLHDTLEDTDLTGEALEAEFGPVVRALVEEVTDDCSVGRAERKREQIERAATLSPAARRIRIADKISNVRSVTYAPPDDWSIERRRDYLVWTAEVVARCRGCCPALEERYDRVLDEGLRWLERTRNRPD
jgi:(p)ppGpp synthase/HD superfamily hydrolase